MSGNTDKRRHYKGKPEIESREETDADAIPLTSQTDHEVHHVSDNLSYFALFLSYTVKWI